MVLPGTLSVALVLLFLSIICFGFWPAAFVLSSVKWRFQLFSTDFAVGALLCCVLAAYTLGTLGADLGFTDSMLVAGQREQAVSFLGGMGFAFANMCFLASVALIGLAPATLFAACIFGFGLALTHVKSGNLVTPLLAAFLMGVGVLIVAIAATSKQRQPDGAPVRLAGGKPGSVRPNIRANRPEQGKQRSPLSTSSKGLITGALAGLGFVGILPLIRLAQPEQLGIGAYGGMLLASAGILLATLCLNFFFFNIELESVHLGYRDYLSGSLKDHLPGFLAGVVWATGALAFYAAQTGNVALSRTYVWVTPFAGAIVTTLCGLFLWQRHPQSPKAKQLTLLAALLLVGGVVALLR